MRRIKAQTLLEYSVVLGLVVSVFIIMNTYIKRSIQAGVRVSFDRLGRQEDAADYTNPRDGSVMKEHSQVRTVDAANPQVGAPSKSKKTLFTGGTQEIEVQEAKNRLSTSIGERVDDGWYYVGGGADWELRRKYEDQTNQEQ